MPAERLPPAQPIYVLRGHIAQVHALHFTHDNSRLLTGDADGWVVSWSLAYKRPVAVWKAHGNAVLGIAGWGGERIITYGFSMYLAGLINTEKIAQTWPRPQTHRMEIECVG